MIYRRFGRTEISMPVFSCGGMRYQHSWQDVAPEDIPKKNEVKPSPVGVLSSHIPARFQYDSYLARRISEWLPPGSPDFFSGYL
ncbi:MAG: hypothetical protein AAFY98_11115, partial [Verrucomicrobiota bacterium]